MAEQNIRFPFAPHTMYGSILVYLEQQDPLRCEKCKQRTCQREAGGRVLGTPVTLETDFFSEGTSLEMLKGWREELTDTHRPQEIYYYLDAAQRGRKVDVVPYRFIYYYSLYV